MTFERTLSASLVRSRACHDSNAKVSGEPPRARIHGLGYGNLEPLRKTEDGFIRLCRYSCRGSCRDDGNPNYERLEPQCAGKESPRQRKPSRYVGGRLGRRNSVVAEIVEDSKMGPSGRTDFAMNVKFSDKFSAAKTSVGNRRPRRASTHCRVTREGVRSRAAFFWLPISLRKIG